MLLQIGVDEGSDGCIEVVQVVDLGLSASWVMGLAIAGQEEPGRSPPRKRIIHGFEDKTTVTERFGRDNAVHRSRKVEKRGFGRM